MTIQVSSPAFQAGGVIPRKYSREGEDISPPLTWDGLPDATKEVVVICDDPDAPTAEPFVHWVVYKIPAGHGGIAEGDPREALEGVTDFGESGYGGPMPPEGHGVHHYHFRVYALDTRLKGAADLTKGQILDAMSGHILDTGELVGTYER